MDSAVDLVVCLSESRAKVDLLETTRACLSGRFRRIAASRLLQFRFDSTDANHFRVERHPQRRRYGGAASQTLEAVSVREAMGFELGGAHHH